MSSEVVNDILLISEYNLQTRTIHYVLRADWVVSALEYVSPGN